MSLQAMVWAVEHAVGRDPNTDEAVDVPAPCMAVLQGLANHAGRDGRNAYPSVELLAHYARKSERSVQRDLAELERLAVIRRGDQRAAYDIPEQYRPTVWDLAMERRRPDYTPRRTRRDDAPRPPADPSRGDAGVTPAAVHRGDVHDGGGVTPTSPEPAPSTRVVTTGGVSHVGTGARDEPPADPPAAAASPAAPDEDGIGAPALDLEDDSAGGTRSLVGVVAALDPATPPVRSCRRWPAPHGSCGTCATDREVLTAWERAAHQDALDRAWAAGQAERDRQARARADADAAVRGCRLCDAAGRLPSGLPCLHDPKRNPVEGSGGRAAWAAAKAVLGCRLCDSAGLLPSGAACSHGSAPLAQRAG